MSEYIIDPSAYLDMRKETIERDGQPLVRCRDCRFCSLVEYEEYTDRKLEEPFYNCTGKLTTNWDYLNECVQYNPVEPDGFCAWGEHRDMPDV